MANNVNQTETQGVDHMPGRSLVSHTSFLWLEITGKCQLACTHCYASSGPDGTHGAMAVEDWQRVIDQAAALGVGTVQFIGGEPTLHPGLPGLVVRALDRGLKVEVFSNLVHVTPALWELFGTTGVQLATSYYSDDPGEHAKITGTRGSHARTRSNIIEAVRRGIPLRVGLVDLDDNQRWEQAAAELEDLGVLDIGTDHLRQVGRGVRGQPASMEQLCGNCASGVLAVAPDGTVWPCVFSRWLPVGNVLQSSLASVLAGSVTLEVRAQLAAHFEERLAEPMEAKCVPKMCNPDCGPNCSPACNPTGCGPTNCGPCAPSYQRRRACGPERSCQPNKCRPTGK